ncbi:hypothetical protein BLJ79_15290 [Arthrobacter sp. UCD-GKA]|nr:hypothetical protein BLJ79_15290 [Arthrobacter sp. UCD-GKA]
MIAATILVAALVWVVARSVPRTRGILKAETARLDSPTRRSAATLLAGWGTAAGWALGAGIAVYLASRVAAGIWLRARNDADLGPYNEATEENHQGFMACQRLPETSPGATETEVQHCMDALGEAPIGPPEVNEAWPILIGWISPMAAALLALALLALLLARRRSSAAGEPAVHSAALRPRGIMSFGPRWALAIPGVASLLLFGLLVATGLNSSPDNWGRFTQLVVPRNGSAASPSGGYELPLTPGTESALFPGWFFGVPIIVAALALLLSAGILLRSLAQAPRPMDPSILEIDDLVRTLKAKFVAGVSGAGLLTALGSMGIHTGGAMLTLAGDVRQVEGQAEFFYHDSMLSGVYLAVAGLLFWVLAILMLVLAFAAVVELVAARSLAVAVALDEEPQGSASPTP